MKQPHQIAKEIIEKYKADLIGDDYETPKHYLQDLITVAITEERARAGKLREALEKLITALDKQLPREDGSRNFCALVLMARSNARQALADYERGE